MFLMKSFGNRSTIAILFAVVIGISNTLRADGVCDIALRSNAFNTSDYSQTSRILLSKRDDVCHSEYNSSAEARAAAESAGGSIGWGPFSLGVSDIKQTSNNKWSVADSRFCRATAEDLDAFTNVTARQTVADVALREWGKCIATNSTGVFVRYTQNEDGSGVTGAIERHIGAPGGGVGTITGIALDDPQGNAGVRCSIGTTQVNLNHAITLNIDRSPTAFACKKTTTSTARVAILTNQGDPDWIPLPSAMSQAQMSLEQVRTSLAAAIDDARRQAAVAAPTGTIAFFSLQSCPSGWSVYSQGAGRVFVAAGNQTATTSTRMLGQTGGEETHTLTIEEMPKHRHQLPTYTATPGNHEVGSGHFDQDWVPAEFSQYEGGGQAHNVMQPFVVLTACKREQPAPAP